MNTEFCYSCIKDEMLARPKSETYRNQSKNLRSNNLLTKSTLRKHIDTLRQEEFKEKLVNKQEESTCTLKEELETLRSEMEKKKEAIPENIQELYNLPRPIEKSSNKTRSRHDIQILEQELPFMKKSKTINELNIIEENKQLKQRLEEAMITIKLFKSVSMFFNLVEM